MPVEPGIAISVGPIAGAIAEACCALFNPGAPQHRTAAAAAVGTVFRSPALPDHAEIVRRTCRLHLDATFERLIVEPVQHALVLFRRNHLFSSDIHSAADRHQQERVERVCAKRPCQFEHAAEVDAHCGGR